MNRIDAVQKMFNRYVGRDNVRAVLGDINGVVEVDGMPGEVYVRLITGVNESGEPSFSEPKMVRMDAVVPLDAGTPVWVGPDREFADAVLGLDFDSYRLTGGDPIYANPAYKANYGFATASKIDILNCHPMSTNEIKSLSVSVRALICVVNGTMYYFGGQKVDLTGYIPTGSDQHLLAGIFLRYWDDTIEVSCSTAQGDDSDLSLADVQECVDGATGGAIPVWFWRLPSGLTSITDDHSFLDGRQFISVNTGPRFVEVPSDATTTGEGFYKVDCSAGSVTITLRHNDVLAVGHDFWFKDTSGNAGINPITIITEGGSASIDLASSKAINSSLGVLHFKPDGFNWWSV